ncbi:hypothetical protein BC830DRAFT_534267 [Chytriomyces sp. MP71]|nr:hypothetical protein BC830DRAFT_534267 [Chytriomyces sp. MP71]
MKLPPPDTTDDYELYDKTIKDTLGLDCIPRNLQYGIGIDHITQIINLARIKVAEKIEMRRLLEENETILANNSKSLELPRLAFGSRPTSEVVSVKRVSRQVRSSKSKAGEHENDVNSISSQCTSRASIHTSEARKVEPVSKNILLPPIVEVRSPPEAGISPRASEKMLPNPSSADEIECTLSDSEIDALESDREEELMNQTKPLFFDNETLDGFNALTFAPGNSGAESNVPMVAPAADEPPEESTLDNEIEAFFKSQKVTEEACEELFQASEQELDESQQPSDEPHEDPPVTSANLYVHENESIIEERNQIGDEYLAHGVQNMDQILTELDKMIIEEDSRVVKAVMEGESETKLDSLPYEHICKTSGSMTSSATNWKDETAKTNTQELEFDFKTSNEVLHYQTTEALLARASFATSVTRKQSNQISASISRKGREAIHSSQHMKQRDSFNHPFLFQAESTISFILPTKKADEDKRPKTLGSSLQFHKSRSKKQLSQIKSEPTSVHASVAISAQKKLTTLNEGYLSSKVVKGLELPCENDSEALTEKKPSAEGIVTSQTRSFSECNAGDNAEEFENNRASLLLYECSYQDVKTSQHGEVKLPDIDTGGKFDEISSLNIDEGHFIEPLLMDMEVEDSFYQSSERNASNDMELPDVGQSRTVSSEINKKLMAHCEATKIELQRHIRQINEHEVLCDFPCTLIQDYEVVNTPLRVTDSVAIKRHTIDFIQDEGVQTAPLIGPSVESVKLGPVQLNSISTTLHAGNLQAGDSNMDQLALAAENLNLVLPSEEDETVELMYDAATNSYYDPATGKYYEIEESDEDEQIGVQ